MESKFGNSLYAFAMLVGVVIAAIDHLENQTVLAQLISGILVTLIMVIYIVSFNSKEQRK